MLNGKPRILLLTVGLIKRHSINERIFSRTKTFRMNNEIELDLPNYTAKTGLKNATGFAPLAFKVC